LNTGNYGTEVGYTSKGITEISLEKEIEHYPEGLYFRLRTSNFKKNKYFTLIAA